MIYICCMLSFILHVSKCFIFGLCTQNMLHLYTEGAPVYFDSLQSPQGDNVCTPACNMLACACQQSTSPAFNKVPVKLYRRWLLIWIVNEWSKVFGPHVSFDNAKGLIGDIFLRNILNDALALLPALVSVSLLSFKFYSAAKILLRYQVSIVTFVQHSSYQFFVSVAIYNIALVLPYTLFTKQSRDRAWHEY
jgi:hypothetical protein